MFHDFPYTDFHELNLDYLFRCCGRGLGLRLDLQGDYLRLVNQKNEVVSQVKVHYSDTALTDVDGRPIQTYIFSAGVAGDAIVFTHGDNTTTTITIPYADKAKTDVQGKDLLDYVYSLSIAGDKLRVTAGDATIYELTIPFATKAATDVNEKDLTTYAASLSVLGDKLVLLDSMGRQLSEITVPYATRALNDGAGDEIEASYADKLQAGTTTVKLLAKDGTLLSEITVPFATEADHADEADHATVATDATNAVEQVTISGDQMIFTTFGGQQYAITAPYAVKAQKDDLGNVIKSTYVASVTSDPNNGELTFLDATGNVIVTLVPTLDKAIHDSYNNLIADYIKQVAVDPNSNYVTVTHGTGVSESLTINYSTHAWKDTNNNVIKNTYITYLECIEDVVDGHYKLVAYDGDNPRAELFRTELISYMAQCDINERALTSYTGGVVVDEDDDTKLNVLDGENNVQNVITGQVTATADGVISGTDVSLTAGTLPSVSYNASTEELTFNPGVFPVVDDVIDGTFTGTPVTSDVNFTDSNT